MFDGRWGSMKCEGRGISTTAWLSLRVHGQLILPPPDRIRTTTDILLLRGHSCEPQYNPAYVRLQHAAHPHALAAIPLNA